MDREGMDRTDRRKDRVMDRRKGVGRERGKGRGRSSHATGQEGHEELGVRGRAAWRDWGKKHCISAMNRLQGGDRSHFQ
jgi:hypothetical protein